MELKCSIIFLLIVFQIWIDNSSSYRLSSLENMTENDSTTSVCPTGMFQCVIIGKVNSLHQTLSTAATNICIDGKRICDGQIDCPNGEDENDCPVQETVCYMCNGSHDQCIPMLKLCDRVVDCPRADDEQLVQCRNRTHHQSIASGMSTFSSNQMAPVNISIVNQAHHREFTEQDERPNNHSPKEISDEPTKDVFSGVRNGVGFMFRIDNMVVYNSQVKMFNQNSENIKPETEENSTQNYQENQKNRYKIPKINYP